MSSGIERESVVIGPVTVWYWIDASDITFGLHVYVKTGSQSGFHYQNLLAKFLVDDEAKVDGVLEAIRSTAEELRGQEERAVKRAEVAKAIKLDLSFIEVTKETGPVLIRHDGHLSLALRGSVWDDARNTVGEKAMTDGDKQVLSDVAKRGIGGTMALLLASFESVTAKRGFSDVRPSVQGTKGGLSNDYGNGRRYHAEYWLVTTVLNAANDSVVLDRILTEMPERSETAEYWVKESDGELRRAPLVASASVTGSGDDYFDVGRGPELGKPLSSILPLLVRYLKPKKFQHGDAVVRIVADGREAMAFGGHTVVFSDVLSRPYRDAAEKANPIEGKNGEGGDDERRAALLREAHSLSPACVVGLLGGKEYGKGGAVVIRSEDAEGVTRFHLLPGDTFAWIVCACGGVTSVRVRAQENAEELREHPERSVRLSFWRGEKLAAFSALAQIPQVVPFIPEMHATCSLSAAVSPQGLDAIKREAEVYERSGMSPGGYAQSFAGDANGVMVSFSLLRRDLAEAVRLANASINDVRVGTEPALSLTTGGKALAVTFVGRGLELVRFGCRLIYPANVTQGGAVVLPLREVTDFLKVATASTVTLQGDAATGQVQLLSGVSVAVRAKPGRADYGVLPEAFRRELAVIGSFRAPGGYERIASTTLAASNDETRSHLGRVCIGHGITYGPKSTGRIGAMATDGHRLCVMSLDGVPVAEKPSTVAVTMGCFPPFLATLERMAMAQLDVTVSGGAADVRGNEKDTVYAASSFDAVNGSFFWHAEGEVQRPPSVEQVIPTAANHVISLRASSLRKAMEKASGKENMRRWEGKLIVEVSETSASFVLQEGRYADDGARSTLDVKASVVRSAKGFRVGMMASYVHDALTAFGDEEVELRCEGELDPCMLSSRDGLSVVMPMRL